LTMCEVFTYYSTLHDGYTAIWIEFGALKPLWNIKVD